MSFKAGQSLSEMMRHALNTSTEFDGVLLSGQTFLERLGSGIRFKFCDTGRDQTIEIAVDLFLAFAFDLIHNIGDRQNAAVDGFYRIDVIEAESAKPQMVSRSFVQYLM